MLNHTKSSAYPSPVSQSESKIKDSIDLKHYVEEIKQQEDKLTSKDSDSKATKVNKIVVSQYLSCTDKVVHFESHKSKELDLMFLKLSRNDMMFKSNSILKFLDVHLKMRQFFERVISSIDVIRTDRSQFFDPDTTAKLIT